MLLEGNDLWREGIIVLPQLNDNFFHPNLLVLLPLAAMYDVFEKGAVDKNKIESFSTILTMNLLILNVMVF